jgi:hypothetical protein
MELKAKTTKRAGMDPAGLSVDSPRAVEAIA